MFFKHEVIENKKLNSKFHRVKLLAKSKSFKYNPGQFITLNINQSVFRSYSIASISAMLPYWEMFVDITPGGPGASYIKNLTKGDIIQTSDPKGQFLLSKGYKNYIFGATGCGIAPFLPMFEKLTKLKNKQVYLFWGLRHKNEITLTQQLNRFKKDNPKFNYKIILSKPNGIWAGKTGHVTPEIIAQSQKFARDKVGIYLSGSGEFIKEASQELSNLKLDAHKIYVEACY